MEFRSNRNSVTDCDIKKLYLFGSLGFPEIGGRPGPVMSPAMFDYSSSSSDSDQEDGVTLNPVNSQGRNPDDSDSCEELDHIAARASRKRKTPDTEQLIMADFEFFDLKADDFHCVRSLLNNWLDGYSEIDLSAISDLIVDQVVLGTIAKTDGNAVALATILPLSAECMASVAKYLTDRADSSALQLLRSSQRIGLLVYERFINLPWQLIPDIFDSLQKDLLWARQNAGPDYEYDTLVFIARTDPAKNKLGKIRFLYEEQDILYKSGCHSFSFPAVAHGNGSECRTRSQLRTAIFMKRSSLPQIVRQMRSLLK